MKFIMNYQTTNMLNIHSNLTMIEKDKYGRPKVADREAHSCIQQHTDYQDSMVLEFAT